MSFKNSKHLLAYVAVAAITTGLMTQQAAAQEPDPIGPKLTLRLAQMLSEEMLSVKQATEQIFNALIVGDNAMVATQAMGIHDSFILERGLTEQDKKDLMKAASPEFLKLDGNFHVTAQKLSEAAQHKDRELQQFYYSRLVETCQTCHSQF